MFRSGVSSVRPWQRSVRRWLSTSGLHTERNCGHL